MRLLRGLGGLGTATLILLTINVSSLHGKKHLQTRDIDTSVLTDALVTAAENQAQAAIEVAIQDVQPSAETAAANTLDSIINTALTPLVEASGVDATQVNADEVALSQALVNLFFDLINQEKICSYVKEELGAFFQALLERLPTTIKT